MVFTTDLSEAVEKSEAIFIAVGTPQGDSGAADLSYVEAVVAEIARAITSYKVIVEKSTVPVYTNDWIRRVLHRHGIEPEKFDVVSNPEFLREGTAVLDFLHPDRIVVGANNERSAEVLRAHLRAADQRQVLHPAGRASGSVQRRASRASVVTSTQSAEIIKHASNAFLAMKISFINAVANLAEAVDADIEDISAGIGLDSRIGPKFLHAGLGYGGSCFPEGRGRVPLGGAGAGRGFSAARRSAQDQRDAEGSFLQQGALRIVDFARQAAGRIGPGLQGRDRRYPGVTGHQHDSNAAAGRRDCDRVRSRGDGARQGSVASREKYALCGRSVRARRRTPTRC